MKVRTLIACAATAAALPLTPAWASANATTLGGPQGTGAYGVVDPLDRDHDGTINLRDPAYRAGADISAPYGFTAYDRNADGLISSDEYAALNEARDEARDERRNVYSGPSWATNPPVPAL
jgi:hypothetical protein